MRIMIFGDSASGKSTFASKLAAKLRLPVIHLDEQMTRLGREQKLHILEYIKEQADQPAWVLDGNAFTKDKDYRIQRADLIIMFRRNRFAALARHIRRSVRVTLGRETAAGGVLGKLKLHYYIPYILWQFPKRRQAAYDRAVGAGKRIIVVNSFRQADQLLKADWRRI